MEILLKQKVATFTPPIRETTQRGRCPRERSQALASQGAVRRGHPQAATAAGSNETTNTSLYQFLRCAKWSY